MKKIPTLFERVYDNHKIVGIKDTITPGCEEAFANGIATIKIDGSCCAVIDDVFYRRYDCKKGRKAPEGAIPCGEPDPVTGHWPHWIKVDPNNPADKWFWEAYKNTSIPAFDATYEAVGPHFQGNPYGFQSDFLRMHGDARIYVERTFESLWICCGFCTLRGLYFGCTENRFVRLREAISDLTGRLNKEEVTI